MNFENVQYGPLAASILVYTIGAPEKIGSPLGEYLSRSELV